MVNTELYPEVLGLFRGALGERRPFCRLGSFMSVQLILLLFPTASLLLLCHGAAPTDRSEIAPNLSSNSIVGDQVSRPAQFCI